MKPEHAEALKGRIEDYLHMQNLRDDTGLLHLNTFVVYGSDGVFAGFRPNEYRCEICRNLSPLEEIVEAVRRRVRFGWCQPCSDLSLRVFERQEEMSARLRNCLLREFAVTLVSPGSPISACVVTG
jgi:hypothetical protein